MPQAQQSKGVYMTFNEEIMGCNDGCRHIGKEVSRWPLTTTLFFFCHHKTRHEAISRKIEEWFFF